MSEIDIDTALEWRGLKVVDRDGAKIGTFDELYLDEHDRPAWAGVTTGLFGLRQTFVPLSQAQRVGDELQVPYERRTVKDAPNIDPSEQLSAGEEDALYQHYGIREAARAPEASGAPTGQRGTAEQGAVRAEDPAPGEEVAPDPSRDAMTRSEEEVAVRTRTRERGRARLKKYVVTDHIQKTIPVRREEVRVEFEPAGGEGENDTPSGDRRSH